MIFKRSPQRWLLPSMSLNQAHYQPASVRGPSWRPSGLPWPSKSFLFYASLALVLISFGYVQAVAECMSGNHLKCFECNSHMNPRCADPFNWTTLPPIKQCDGCCVKIVQGIGTPDFKVRRTCTDDIDINMFMVDHVCMTEGGGRGKMCFCEENECNSAWSPMRPAPASRRRSWLWWWNSALLWRWIMTSSVGLAMAMVTLDANNNWAYFYAANS